MLVAVLRFNPIACQHPSTRERHVTIMMPLGIAKIIGGASPRRRAPEAAPIRSRTVLSSSQASLGAILHDQPLSGIWKPRQGSDFFIGGRFGLPSCRGGPGQPQPQLRRTQTCFERIRRQIAMPSEMRCEWSTNSIRLQPVAVTTFLLRVMGLLVFPVEATHMTVAGALHDGSRPHILV